MQTVYGIAQLLITEWLWALSWGQYQMFLSITFLVASLRFVCQWSLLSSMLLALFSQIGSFVLFGIFVYGIVFQLFGITYDPNQVVVYNPLQAGVQLAFIFTLLQTVLLWFFTRSYHLPFYKILVVVFVSNILGALFAARTIPNMVL